MNVNVSSDSSALHIAAVGEKSSGAWLDKLKVSETSQAKHEKLVGDSTKADVGPMIGAIYHNHF